MSLKMAYRWRIKKGQQFWLQRKKIERESILYTVVKLLKPIVLVTTWCRQSRSGSGVQMG